ncbi:hypothetical protein [Pseudomonas sp. NFR16]|uniref:hypothetical protein n=1 Tax=Pseudomonas sp. NFR16 TaxID=1566248 RepID=UPI0008CD95B7|nr:hypothetical protein [Pseudomonas sp. NFR16]SEJ77151.1 hypothetical protein SAMN03159495_4449 [Pseudomonas sp. NFR16]
MMMDIVAAKAIENPLAFIGISVAAASLLVAISSLTLTWRLWRKTNRPILTAWIASAAAGEKAIALNIVLENSGNRPAKDIKLVAIKKHVLAALDHPNGAEIPGDARHCFFSDKQISVLANGKRITNAFGHLGGESGAWKSGGVIPLVIEYRGLENERYRARMNLILVDDNGFAQSSWGSAHDL